MLDYARLNRSILNQESVLCLPERADWADSPILRKWREEFPLVLYRSLPELGHSLRRQGVEVIYLTKPGPYDRILIPGVKNCVHAQFLCNEFHGDVYGYLSGWMSRVMTGREDSFVPFFVPRLESAADLRATLGISRMARVFGRHGGRDTFNIPFARTVVAQHALHHPEDHFVFLNTDPMRGTEKLPNVHYLPATVDAGEKAAFLRTCDVMIHARWHGETFGLAVGEFAVLGKPVLTYAGSRERAHLEMLGASAHAYHHARELATLLECREFPVSGETEYHRYAEPRRVMEMFQRVFLS